MTETVEYSYNIMVRQIKCKTLPFNIEPEKCSLLS